METPPSPTGNSPSPPAVRSADEVQNWIVNRLAQLQQIDPDEVRTDEPLVAIGLDSMEFVVLVGELEQWLGCRFTDNPLIDYPTIDSLSKFLSSQLAQGKTLIDPTQR